MNKQTIIWFRNDNYYVIKVGNWIFYFGLLWFASNKNQLNEIIWGKSNCKWQQQKKHFNLYLQAWTWQFVKTFLIILVILRLTDHTDFAAMLCIVLHNRCATLYYHKYIKHNWRCHWRCHWHLVKHLYNFILLLRTSKCVVDNYFCCCRILS